MTAAAKHAATQVHHVDICAEGLWVVHTDFGFGWQLVPPIVGASIGLTEWPQDKCSSQQHGQHDQKKWFHCIGACIFCTMLKSWHANSMMPARADSSQTSSAIVVIFFPPPPCEITTASASLSKIQGNAGFVLERASPDERNESRRTGVVYR